MHNENLVTKRHDWSFPYKAKMLMPYAQRKLATHQAEETAMRKKLSEMIQDPATFHNDTALQNLKRDIDRHSALREQFQVYVHEFARLPEQEYRLGLSDIVFFGFLEGTLPPA
jgi:hypothetical protein